MTNGHRPSDWPVTISTLSGVDQIWADGDPTTNASELRTVRPVWTNRRPAIMHPGDRRAAFPRPPWCCCPRTAWKLPKAARWNDGREPVQLDVGLTQVVPGQGVGLRVGGDEVGDPVVGVVAATGWAGGIRGRGGGAVPVAGWATP
jgi:hypothetical protein